jgi:hypothetical protein
MTVCVYNISASAAMIGLKIVAIKSDEQGNVDMVDLKEKVEKVTQLVSGKFTPIVARKRTCLPDDYLPINLWSI